MNAMTDIKHHHAKQETGGSPLARRWRFGAVGAVGALIGSLSGGAAYYAGPTGIVVSMLVGGILLFAIGSERT